MIKETIVRKFEIAGPGKLKSVTTGRGYEDYYLIITLKARYGGIEENGESRYCCDIGKVKMPLKKEDYEEIRNKLLNNKTKDMNGILAVEGELKMDEQDKWYIVEKRNNIRTQH